MENGDMEHKIVTHINCPEGWKSGNDWDSHLPMLYLGVDKYGKYNNIVEFGMGNGSTLALKRWFNGSGNGFTSLETNSEWAIKFVNGYTSTYYPEVDMATYEKDNHLVLRVKEYSDYCVVSSNVGYLVFIDSAPGEERKDIINRFYDKKSVLIIHDTEIGAEYVYSMKDILSTFKYRLDYRPEGKPHTTAVSNEIDVTQWIQS